MKTFFQNLILLSFLLPLLGLSQEKTDVEPTAEQILDMAAKKQGGERIAKKPVSFEAYFTTQYYNKEKGQINFEVKRIFQAPYKLWTRKNRENKKPTYEVYDGEDSWFVEADGKVIVYTEKPATHKTDIENIERDAKLTRQMLKFFFVAAMKKEIKDLKRVKDSIAPTADNKRGEPSFLLEGKSTGWIGGEKETTVVLHIYVGKKSHQVNAVRMMDPNHGGMARLFLFSKYMENDQGVRIPLNIKMFRGTDPFPEMTIGIFCERKEETKKVIPRIWFNKKVDPKLFICPEEP